MFSSWAAPADNAAWLAVFVAVALVCLRARQVEAVLTRASGGWFLGSAMLAAFGLSSAYQAYYLGGAPRIIDATTYWLAAKLQAAGSFSFAPDGPPGSYAGRFLLNTPEGALATLFPPGYPSLLAIGVWLGQPMSVGPCLGAGIVAATYWFGRRLFDERTARVAALLSVGSATLRYHTADSMSHALCALLLTLCVGLTQTRSLRRVGLAGLCCGWLCATRPVTGLCCLMLCVVFVAYPDRSKHSAGDTGTLVRSAAATGCLLLGCIPGWLLLLAQQHAVTGELFGSLQYLYYARSDAPGGCFRYGFGDEIGCRFEHGAFLDTYMPHGYGPVEALRTTGRRLAAHLSDAANWELFTLLLPYLIWRGRSHVAVRRVAYVLTAIPIAYAPFYFDGNYPGGGGRMFVDVLPFEHVLIAWGLCQWRLPRAGLCASALAFALHASAFHRALRDSDGGAPMFNRTLLQAAGVTRGLVFVDTDHGFNLGYEPKQDPRTGIAVARRRGDANDWSLYRHFGAPPSYRYLFDAEGRSAPRVETYVPAPATHYAGASFWPPAHVTGGSTFPGPPTCATNFGALALRPAAEREMGVTLEVWLPGANPYELSVNSTGPVDAEGVLHKTPLANGCVRTVIALSASAPGRRSIHLTTAQAIDLASLELTGASVE
jgi:hypothetical protein